MNQIEEIKVKKGNGQTGYWRDRGAFTVYVNGHYLGTEPTPEKAQALIDRTEEAIRA